MSATTLSTARKIWCGRRPLYFKLKTYEGTYCFVPNRGDNLSRGNIYAYREHFENKWGDLGKFATVVIQQNLASGAYIRIPPPEVRCFEVGEIPA